MSSTDKQGWFPPGQVSRRDVLVTGALTVSAACAGGLIRRVFGSHDNQLAAGSEGAAAVTTIGLHSELGWNDLRSYAALPPKEKGALHRGPKETKRIALTVDDFTGTVGIDYLEPLLNYNVPLTLFPTGAALDAFGRAKKGDLWKRAILSGMVVGNHTYHHYLQPESGKGFKDLNRSVRASEVTLAQSALDSVLGHAYPMKFMRPPGGSGGFGEKDSTVVSEMAALGLWTCMWTLDSNDDEKHRINPGDDFFLSKVHKVLETDKYGGNGAIVLIHPTTLSIGGMGKMIELVTSRGLTPTTIPGLYGA